MNECANFYFEVSRGSKECPVCTGNGYHPDAQKIVRTFYQHSCEPGEVPWNNAITDDEAEALVAAGRSEEHTSELQSLMRISYAVSCVKNTQTLDNIDAL